LGAVLARLAQFAFLERRGDLGGMIQIDDARTVEKETSRVA